MIQETRSAVEVTGIAHAIQHDSEKLRVFLADDGGDRAARKAAKKAFKPENIFPFDNPALKQLAQSYQTASLLAHTNLVTLTQHIAEQGESSATFVLQDLQGELVPQFLIWCAVTHMSILSLVDKIFHDVVFDCAAFDRERRYAIREDRSVQDSLR